MWLKLLTLYGPVNNDQTAIILFIYDVIWDHFNIDFLDEEVNSNDNF